MVANPDARGHELDPEFLALGEGGAQKFASHPLAPLSAGHDRRVESGSQGARPAQKAHKPDHPAALLAGHEEVVLGGDPIALKLREELVLTLPQGV
jgi:hypothetical protein